MISHVERTIQMPARGVVAASLFWAAVGGWLALAGKAALAGGPPEGETAVRVISVPAGCFVPDTAIDAKGVLHMVYAKDRNAILHALDGQWRHTVGTGSGQLRGKNGGIQDG